MNHHVNIANKRWMPQIFVCGYILASANTFGGALAPSRDTSPNLLS